MKNREPQRAELCMKLMRGWFRSYVYDIAVTQLLHCDLGWWWKVSLNSAFLRILDEECPRSSSSKQLGMLCQFLIVDSTSQYPPLESRTILAYESLTVPLVYFCTKSQLEKRFFNQIFYLFFLQDSYKAFIHIHTPGTVCIYRLRLSFIHCWNTLHGLRW